MVYSSIDELIQELNQAVDALAAKVFGEAIPESVIARSSAPIELTAEQRYQRLRKFTIAGDRELTQSLIALLGGELDGRRGASDHRLRDRLAKDLSRQRIDGLVKLLNQLIDARINQG